MTPGDREILIEKAASAHRPRHGRDLPVDPSWYDLDEAGREQAFATARVLRMLEAALDDDGLSTTVRAVLARIERHPSAR